MSKSVGDCMFADAVRGYMNMGKDVRDTELGMRVWAERAGVSSSALVGAIIAIREEITATQSATPARDTPRSASTINRIDSGAFNGA